MQSAVPATFYALEKGCFGLRLAKLRVHPECELDHSLLGSAARMSYLVGLGWGSGGSC